MDAATKKASANVAIWRVGVRVPEVKSRQEDIRRLMRMADRVGNADSHSSKQELQDLLELPRKDSPELAHMLERDPSIVEDAKKTIDVVASRSSFADGFRVVVARVAYRLRHLPFGLSLLSANPHKEPSRMDS